LELSFHFDIPRKSLKRGIGFETGRIKCGCFLAYTHLLTPAPALSCRSYLSAANVIFTVVILWRPNMNPDLSGHQQEEEKGFNLLALVRPVKGTGLSKCSEIFALLGCYAA
jgi:hypothetical protein